MSFNIKKILFYLFFFIFFSDVVFCNSILIKKSKITLIKNNQLKGIWLTTAFCLDWPPYYTITLNSDSVRIKLQKQDLIKKLNKFVKIGINTVFFQVKPDITVFYKSDILPYSNLLTGTIGKDPGYDPLKFIITEAHKRNIKIHAWLNPYRVFLSIHKEFFDFFSKTVYFKRIKIFFLNKNIIKKTKHYYSLDPGEPESNKLIIDVVHELIRNYDIDGIQFDDYFYQETYFFKFDDSITFQKYKKKFLNKNDWRRNNTCFLIKKVSSMIKLMKPLIKFGISPSAVWRNFKQDNNGSDTNIRNTNYDTDFADTKLWVKKGFLDYIAPQIYYSFDKKNARYDKIVKWWANVVRSTNTKLYIGIALYKAGEFIKDEKSWYYKNGVYEIKKQFDFNDKISEVNGVILFRANYLNITKIRDVINYIKFKWNNFL